MATATHRVIGVLEWPARSEMMSSGLDALRQQLLSPSQEAPRQILSWRLPLPDAGDSELLTADLSQLGLDLRCLFEQFTAQRGGLAERECRS